jgi:hypothetical protein
MEMLLFQGLVLNLMNVLDNYRKDRLKREVESTGIFFCLTLLHRKFLVYLVLTTFICYLVNFVAKGMPIILI